MSWADRRIAVAVALDTAAVLVFVAIGRRSHDEGSAVSEVVRIAAPFLIAAAIGWLVARAWRDPYPVPTGAVVWAVTVAVGMVLRNVVFDRGTAVSFVVVTAVFLGLAMLGWRVVVGRLVVGCR